MSSLRARSVGSSLSSSTGGPSRPRIHAKDLLAHANVPNPPRAGEITNPAYFVPENEKIVDLLKHFQTKNIHMAIVTDEFGITRGLVTLEDILEEIVGEITDEYDKDEPHWRVEDGSLTTDAKVHIEEVEDFFHVELPEGPYDSIGGLQFTVLLSTKRRIITVQITKATAAENGPSD